MSGEGTSRGGVRRIPRPLVLLLLALLALTAYSPALAGDFVWDDDSYVTENENLEDAAGLRRVWLEPRSSPQYYPLVFTTFWLERRAWGEEPLGFHVVNVLLHATGAFLLWRLLARLRVPGALLAALVFLLHPVHVESVAWITERKNVLSLVLALGSALAWLRFRPPPGAPAPGRAAALGWWSLALLFFCAALASKTVTACLPIALAIVAWWQRGALRPRDWVPLLPFLLVAVPAGLLTSTLEREHVGASGVEWDHSLLERILIAGRVFWFYVEKLLWPADLAFFYRRWEIDGGEAWQYVFPAAVVVLFAVLWLSRRRVGRGPLAAFLVLGFALGPASGFFDVYPMRYAFVADHFVYHGSTAVIALAAALLVRGGERLGRPALAGVLAVALLAALGTATWRSASRFAGPEVLWRRTLAVTPESWAARANLGHMLLARGEREAGEELLLEAAELSPYPSEAWQDAAYLLAEAGDVEGALEYYEPLLEARPVVADRVAYLALSYFDRGRRPDALRLLEAAVRVVPGASLPRLVLGGLYDRSGRREDALEQYEAVLAREPDSPEAHYSLGGMRARAGDFDAAIRHYERALAARPDWEAARRALARAREMMPR